MATKNLREAFCLAYHSLPDVKGRGVRAAVLAGYSEKTATVTASKMLADPKIKRRLDELAGRVPVSTPDMTAHTPVAPGAVRPGTAYQPSSPPGASQDPMADPFEGEQIADPKDFLRKAMNNSKLDPKLRIDAAKKLIDFEHAKLGEVGKKEQKQEAAKTAGGGKFATSAPPRLVASGGKAQ